MFNPIILLAMIGGLLAGLTAGWFLFSKGKKISMTLQSQISEQERQLGKLEGKLQEARNHIKTAETEARATSHHGYNYDGGVASWPSDAGIVHRAAWGPATGRSFVSGGSHAGHVHEPGNPRAAGGRLVGDAPLPTPFMPERWTPASHLRLIPIETLGPGALRTRFAITPPWLKIVYADPEWEGT